MTCLAPVPLAAALNVTVDGVARDFYLPPNDFLRAVVLNVLEGREYPLLRAPHYAPRVILDVGANVGASVLLFHGAYPGATIHCYEPAADNLRYLEANIAGLPGVVLHPYGLLDRDAVLPLYHGASQSAQHSLIRNEETSGRSESVELRRAAAELAALGLAEVGILKLDTEGAELPILRDLLPALSALDLVYLEYHSAEDRRAIDQFLAPRFELAASASTAVHRGTLVYVSREFLRACPSLDTGRIGGAVAPLVAPATSPLEEPAGGAADGAIQHLEVGLPGDPAPLPVHLRLDTRDFSQRSMLDALVQGRFYEPEVSYFLANVLAPGDTFIDVGGHVGYFSMLAARVVGPTGRVYAFEPEAANAARIREHIALNGLGNVEVREQAVGDATGEARLFINADNDGGHALFDMSDHPECRRTRERHETRVVQVGTLADLLVETAGQRIRLVKIDAEGSEHRILKGGMLLLKAREVPFVICEINEFGLHRMGASGQGLRSFMAAFGYHCYRMSADAPHLVPFPPEEEFASRYVYNVLFSSLPVPT
jgi:FkbM family methyltransferase